MFPHSIHVKTRVFLLGVVLTLKFFPGLRSDLHFLHTRRLYLSGNLTLYFFTIAKAMPTYLLALLGVFSARLRSCFTLSRA